MSMVWLLMYDLYHRNFTKRSSKDSKSVVNLFEVSKLTEVEEALWKERIKLAASVSRLRIKNSALKLNELLPRHLRESKIIGKASDSPITCWINIKKIK